MAQSQLTVPPQKILVIAMPYLGDVLLATPVWHSLRLAYPEARIDALVFETSAGMLAGNPDINEIIGVSRKAGLKEKFALIKRLFRRYDLAIALQTGDRPFIYTLLAAPFRVNAVPPKPLKTWWKRFFVQRWLEFDNEHTHTVLQNLKLLDLIKVPRQFVLVPPQLTDNQALRERFEFLNSPQSYVVVHPLPQFVYKRWTTEGWLAVIKYLDYLGFKVILSGGPNAEEMNYCWMLADSIKVPVISIAGQVSLAELGYVIGNAKLFIGPDTGVTHLAAATGVPVIALFGPTNPVKWAPWPFGYKTAENPFAKVGNQRVNNVLLLQGKAACVPCHLSGCDNHNQSRSDCLETLAPDIVQAGITQMLTKVA